MCEIDPGARQLLKQNARVPLARRLRCAAAAPWPAPPDHTPLPPEIPPPPPHTHTHTGTAQFPGVPIVPDVALLTALPKETELLVAGFPCIDVSRAGLQQGLTGAVRRLAQACSRLPSLFFDHPHPGAAAR